MTANHTMNRRIIVQIKGDEARMTVLNQSKTSGLWGSNNHHKGPLQQVLIKYEEYCSHFDRTDQPYKVFKYKVNRFPHWQSTVKRFGEEYDKRYGESVVKEDDYE